MHLAPSISTFKASIETIAKQTVVLKASLVLRNAIKFITKLNLRVEVVLRNRKWLKDKKEQQYNTIITIRMWYE